MPARWPRALDAVAGCFGDVGAALVFRRDDGNFSAIVSPALEAAVSDYNQTW